jgi:large subunit ribosomal protein L17
MGRLRDIRRTVTEVIRYERIEKNHNRAEVTREYVERLISEALRYGDRHKPTMELANWWLTDKTLIPKLFKVLVERYRDWPVGLPFTRLLRAPNAVVPQYDG